MDQPNTKEQTEEEHTFKFRFNSEVETFAVMCNTFMTVLEALNTNKSFTTKNKSSQKEIAIQRSDGAAVKTDFPCCLIEKDETLTITFIKNKKTDFTEQQTHKTLSRRRTDLVTFNIKPTGGKNVVHILKNNELRKPVCVYALKEEKLKTALERDGRFKDTIFQKHCVLECLDSDSQEKLCHEKRYEMTHPTEHLDKKTFQIIAIGDSPKTKSQKKQTDVETESDEASKASDSAKNDPDQHLISTKHKETLHYKEFTTLSRKWSIIPDSTEILKILRNQYEDNLNALMKHKKLSNNFQVQTVYRAEYDKSVQRFSETRVIKQLVKLSDSVCQIRLDNTAKGTGFLLFGQFILTNAHVVMECVESPDRLFSTRELAAVFDFDDLYSRVKLVPVKKQIAAYCFLTDASNNHHDFALLELEAFDEITGRPGLLHFYSPGPPPNRGGICIVGHPDGGTKRIDFSFIIGKENRLQATITHISENVSFIHNMSHQCSGEQWKTFENYITYDSCFFHGSSGSPVFDEHCKLIGIHTGGYVYRQVGDQARSIMEYSYSMQPILDMIRAQARIRGRPDILRVLESSVPEFAEQQNQEDYNMENVEEF